MQWPRLVFVGLLAGALGLAAGVASAGEAAMTMRKMTLEQQVGPEVFRAAGLDGLRPEQQRILADWLEAYSRDLVRSTEEACRRQGPGGAPTWPSGK